MEEEEERRERREGEEKKREEVGTSELVIHSFIHLIHSFHALRFELD